MHSSGPAFTMNRSNTLTRTLPSIAFALAALASTACTTLDRNAPREPSHAIADAEIPSTELGRRWAAIAPEDPSINAFRLLPNSLEALAVRIVLIDLAERTLDLQYYILVNDDTGRFLIERLVAAADRGVRVRLLLDDMYAHGVEGALMALDAHPNIELRIFNPWTQRGGMLARGTEFLFTPRLNHRMHNKLLIADGIVGIFGGRNIGDEYFSHHAEFEFRDLDVAVAGPVVAEGSALFDAFWNGPDAVALGGLDPAPDWETEFADARAALVEHRAEMQESRYARAVKETRFVEELEDRSTRWIFAPARLLADSPDKTSRAGDPEWSGSLSDSVRQVITGAQRELLASSPYFVPRRQGCESLAELTARGVEVVILTNSFAANDVGLVHAAYSRHRPRMVRDGVVLYEMRRRGAQDEIDEVVEVDVLVEVDALDAPDGPPGQDGQHLAVGDDPEESARAFGSANASLHAKTFVVDRERVFIGSMNLDPRSVAWNTELGLLIESPELAEQVAQAILALTVPSLSYRVSIGPLDELIWIGEDADGHELIFRHDPDTSAWERLSNGFAGLLPIEGQL